MERRLSVGVRRWEMRSEGRDGVAWRRRASRSVRWFLGQHIPRSSTMRKRLTCTKNLSFSFPRRLARRLRSLRRRAVLRATRCRRAKRRLNRSTQLRSRRVDFDTLYANEVVLPQHRLEVKVQQHRLGLKLDQSHIRLEEELELVHIHLLLIGVGLEDSSKAGGGGQLDMARLVVAGEVDAEG